MRLGFPASLTFATEGGLQADNVIEEHAKEEFVGSSNMPNVSFVDQSLQEIHSRLHWTHALDTTAHPVDRFSRNKALVRDHWLKVSRKMRRAKWVKNTFFYIKKN